MIPLFLVGMQQAYGQDCIDKMRINIHIDDIAEDSFSASWHLEEEKTELIEQLLHTTRRVYEQDLGIPVEARVGEDTQGYNIHFSTVEDLIAREFPTFDHFYTFGKDAGFTTILDQLTTKQITWNILPEARKAKEEPYKTFLNDFLQDKKGIALRSEKKAYLLSTDTGRSIFEELEKELPGIYEQSLSTTLAHELGHLLGLEHSERKYQFGQRMLMYPSTFDLFDISEKETEYKLSKKEKEVLEAERCITE